MSIPYAALACAALLCVYILHRRRSRSSLLADIRGPNAESFLLGNYRQIRQGQVGEVDFEWQERYGAVLRFKAPLGEDRLMICDPKAIQHIFQTNFTNYTQPPQDREVLRTLLGPGIAWADADTHRRHRKVMSPAFGVAQAKSLIPLFRATAESLTSKWRTILISGDEEDALHEDIYPVVINLPKWINRASLDIIGEAAFGYDIGALDDLESELGKAYENMTIEAFALPNTAAVLAQGCMHLLPPPVVRFLFDHIPNRGLERLRSVKKVVNGVARSLVTEERGVHSLDRTRGGMGKAKGFDLLTLLINANSSHNGSSKLSREEMLAQVCTVLFAGHDTTAATLCFALYELAKDQRAQQRLRDEIRAARARGVRDLEDKDKWVNEIDNLPYFNSVIKEVLRLHPVGYHMNRQPRTDDVIPLHKPIVTSKGEQISDVFVPAGTKMIISVAGYHRNKDVWGPDAHAFKPERWLDASFPGLNNKTGLTVGMYSNLMTFSGGFRSCLGWRIALFELQTFLFDLIDQFHFSLTKDATRLRREPCLVMAPMVEGQSGKGAQLPLQVSIAPRD
ncbi:cytochrome P450 [Neolentinus lepideus HHB14362 ss-1]|uniref:Cytochrome P450 n=1 Tax=Neolentinus lepideus HHB14362 ss-1 TaxID=1314782 RepID=A0A165MLS2_9AGAM|nr:cytochrome P450 [Neolentinus lepideus HHB14362 ss-1]